MATPPEEPLLIDINARLRAHEYILAIMLADMALERPDRHKYIRRIFELATARVEQVPLEKLEASALARAMEAKTRSHIERILRLIDEGI